MSTTNSTNNDVSTPVQVNLGDIEASWSPLDVRKGRDDGGNEKMKVRSLNGNTRALRGGDWISSSRGILMTLGVAWIEHEHGGKQYGLTVAHEFARHALTIGDSVFAFDSDDEPMTKLNGTRAHKSIKIGTIVSIDVEGTDSTIFEIFPSIMIDPLAVALSGGDDQVRRITLPRPFALPTTLPHGQKLVMYGAARRGMIGVRVEVTDRLDDLSAAFAAKSYETTHGGDGIAKGGTKLSYQGDCGALYLGEDGIAWCMHTTIQGVPMDNPSVWTSRGALLQDIVNRHSFYFGGDPNYLYSSSNGSQSSPVNIALEKIIDDPKTGGQYPRIDFSQEDEEDCLFEKQPAVSHERLPIYIPGMDDDNDDNKPDTEEEKKRAD